MDQIRMKSSKEKNGASWLSKIPKPVGIGIFYAICLLVAIMVVTHNNPLAPDQHTEN